MIKSLHIRNFVLIDELHLALAPGLNVVTGEPGAGKSLLIDALAFALGGPSSAGLVRQGAARAVVEAAFELAEPLVIRRILHPSGRSRAYVNDRPVGARQLARLGADLADITSQHESVAIVQPRRQLDALDDFAGVRTERASLAARVQQLAELDAAVAELTLQLRSRAEREAFLRAEIDAIDRADPKPGERASLLGELELLRHAERRRSAIARAVRFLDGSAEGGGACDELGRVASELGAAAEVDGALGDAANDISLCWSKLADLSRDLRRYGERVDADPARLEAVQERLYRLEQLARRLGSWTDRSGGPATAGALGGSRSPAEATSEDLLATREQMAAELCALANGQERLPQLIAARDDGLAESMRLARALSEKRGRAASRLGCAISDALSELGMARAKVAVQIADKPLSATGIDRVGVLIAPNGGQLRPLGEVASGGELSRVLVALRQATAPRPGEERGAGLMVLDEIDSGVGGQAAERVGRAIARAAQGRQVLCVTHLAAIAAYAEEHFVATKTGAAAPVCSIARLSDAGRIAELARMLTGSCTDTAQDAARALIEAARAHRARDSAPAARRDPRQSRPNRSHRRSSRAA